MNNTIGIDVSKDKLDIFDLELMEHRQFDNDADGLRCLIGWLNDRHALTVFEASGCYHSKLETGLSEASLPYSKVNPCQARRFAEATGKIAKTDRVDAEVLARMGSVLQLESQSPKSENMSVLKDLTNARRGLIKDRVAVKTRMPTTMQTLIKRQLNERLAQVERHLKQLDGAIKEAISANAQLVEKLNILKSIPGISDITASAMLIEMPELGTMNGKQAACLAGLAPISRQSGRWQGKERIRGGRAFVRRALYMPALCTIRHNLSSKQKYDQMVKAGKPPKVALTAIMRRLIVVANALLRYGRSWTENRT
ncbi:IS110 family transposase [Oceaniovalibus sp. ACAM 378]|uniref:IS110 family transposase n=1 Tax=Oceaniovalibus sp. ACAM 378 TaxID=2599923 RepID=UPI0011D5CC0C|nr:IS110 family transposase [Oceaniovalibus sp. ACAM 378]TYB82643.1 IS110 family transposase [Oceaniovalibus sp. ACAM 378]